MIRKTLATLAAVTLFALAACGSSGSGGSSGSSGPKLTGDPIVIGTLGGYTGNQSGQNGLVDDTMQVWADYINDNGGVNGHPVKLIVKDDAGDPAKALQAAKELVEQDHVVAIVGHSSLVSSSWVDYVAEKKIPIIGGLPIESTSFTSPDVFPIGTNVVSLIVGQFVRMHEEGLSKMGLFYCAESPVCESLDGLARASASLVSPDLQIAYSTKISATQPSYSAECLAAKDAGVDSLFAGLGAPVVVALAEGCNMVGFNPVDVGQTSVYSPQSLASQPLDGSILVSPTANYMDESYPENKRFLDALGDYSEIKDSPQFAINTQWAWLGAEMFLKAAENANIGPDSKPADLFQGLYEIKDETLEGAIPPTTYVKGKPTFTSCWFDVNLEGGTFKSEISEPRCLTDEQLAGLQEILAGG